MLNAGTSEISLALPFTVLFLCLGLMHLDDRRVGGGHEGGHVFLNGGAWGGGNV